MAEQTKVTGLILAGGLARRMGNLDKGLVIFNGQPLVSYAVSAMKPVVDKTIISANRNISEYEQFGVPVISDLTDTYDGPLAGILSAMLFVKTGCLLVMPCDTPLVKAKHLHKLTSEQSECDADVAVAFDGERMHPVFLAVKTTLLPDLQQYLQSGQRKMETWLERQKWVKVDFSHEPTIFANINSLAELADLESENPGQ